MKSAPPRQRPGTAFVWNQAKDRWDRVADNKFGGVRGGLAEQEAGFLFSHESHIVFEGPSGTFDGATGMAHKPNAHGFDGVVYDFKNKKLVIYDAKSLQRRTVPDATAIVENLEQNLEGLERRLKAARKANGSSEMLDHMLKDVRAALKSVRNKTPWPKNVELAIVNPFGRSTKIHKELEKLGIKFIDWRNVSRIVESAKKGVAKRAGRMAAQKLVWRRMVESTAAAQLAKKVGQGASRRFVQNRLGKVIAKRLTKVAALKVAKRGASLIPLFGWGFAANDAANGVEDILRGHVARGMAGIGLAIADVSADALHAGDAVTGVGGTALSLGAQAATIAGQIAVEMDREKDKMQELKQEIDKNGFLPPDSRLKDYYGLDQEDIDSMKKELQEEMSDQPPAAPGQGPRPMPLDNLFRDPDDYDDDDFIATRGGLGRRRAG